MARELFITLLCIKVSDEWCARPGTPAFGQLRNVETVYESGDNATYYCYKGYLLSDKTPRTCLESGRWSKVVPVCGSFMIFKAATYETARGVLPTTKVIDRNYKTQEELFQNSGFIPNATLYLSRIHTIIQIVLILSARDTHYHPIRGSPLYATVTIYNDNTEVGKGDCNSQNSIDVESVDDKLLRILCHFQPGYQGNKITVGLGSSFVKSWRLYEVDSYGFNIAAFCGSPEVPKHAFTVVDVDSNTLTIHCKTGYRSSSDTARTVECAWGHWPWTHVNCEQIYCPSLPEIENGRIIPLSQNNSNVAVGSVVYFVCNSGYKISGEESIICEADGVWSADPSVCEAIISESLPMGKMSPGLMVYDILGIASAAIVVCIGCAVTVAVLYRCRQKRKFKATKDVNEHVYQDVDAIYSRQRENANNDRSDGPRTLNVNQPVPEYNYISLDSGAFDCTNAQSNDSYTAVRINENYETVEEHSMSENPVAVEKECVNSSEF